MQKISWPTIPYESFNIQWLDWKKKGSKGMVKDAIDALEDLKIHFSINEYLTGLDIPDYEDISIKLADIKIPQIDLDFLSKLTLEDNFEVKLAGDAQTTSAPGEQKPRQIETGDSTSTSTQRQMNWELLDEFNRKQPKFVYLLHHSVFEDGFDNEATLFFKELFKKDPCISLLWLNGVYTDNQKDAAVLEGILRIISLLDAVGYRKYILPMVKASFNDENVEVQEAAIMVAERWRNKMCLDALQTTKFASEWIKEYANQVMEELKEELADEVSEND